MPNGDRFYLSALAVDLGSNSGPPSGMWVPRGPIWAELGVGQPNPPAPVAPEREGESTRQFSYGVGGQRVAARAAGGKSLAGGCAYPGALFLCRLRTGSNGANRVYPCAFRIAVIHDVALPLAGRQRN